MNKFTFDRETVVSSIGVSLIIITTVVLTATITGTPKFTACFVVSTLALIPYFYLSFLTTSKELLAWLPQSALVFYIMVIFSLLAYGDEVVFGIV